MICIPLKTSSISKLLKNLPLAQKEGDIIEIWFDEIKKLNSAQIDKIIKLKNKPFIYKSNGDYSNIEKILAKKIEYIDIDIKTNNKIIKNIKSNFPNTKIIISYHNYQETPNNTELSKLIKKFINKGADIIKIATQANDFTDSIRILGLLEKTTTEKNMKAIMLCMGDKGKITRISGHLFGNYLMYAPLKEKDKTASGQVDTFELRRIQELLK